MVNRTLVYDVVVLGGGPAGSAAALTFARRGVDVLLIESSDLDEPRVGETLPPEINPLLRTLGVWDRYIDTAPVASPGIVSIWGTPDINEREFIANPFGSGWHIDRRAFDECLFDAAATAGADTLRGVRAASVRRASSGCWDIQLRGTERCVAARFVIDATGKNGLRLSSDDRRLLHDRTLALFLRIEHVDTPSDLRTVIESVPNGWWYWAPVPGRRSVAALFVDPAVYGQGVDVAAELAGTSLIRPRVTSGGVVAARVVHARSSVRARAAGAGWAAVGDAAASYDPLTGLGIVKAFQEALLLADAYTAKKLDEYDAEVRRRFAVYARRLRAQYASERRWRHKGFWRAREAVVIPDP